VINEIKNDTKQRMQKSVESLQNEFTKMRTGRAHPGLLDDVKVSYYGEPTPLKQVASVTVSDARTLLVEPWEKNLVQAIEKAIITADLGLNPATAGTSIRVPMPALTEERRKDLVRVARNEAEKARIAVRNVRRDALSDVKELLKEKMIGEDDERGAKDVIQKITDQYVAEIDSLLQSKETDIMAI